MAAREVLEDNKVVDLEVADIKEEAAVSKGAAAKRAVAAMEVVRVNLQTKANSLINQTKISGNQGGYGGGQASASATATASAKAGAGG